jgi:hypothetical protein
MSNEDQIVELLREIRDTQREHLEYYRAFTEKLAKDSDAHYREWQSERDNVNRFRHDVVGTRIGSLVVLLVVAIFILIGVAMFLANK